MPKKGKGNVKLYSVREFFGTELAEEMFEKMRLPKEEKKLWLDRTFRVPQYLSLEMARGFCGPRKCRRCNTGSGKGGSFINPECVEEFFGLP